MTFLITEDITSEKRSTNDQKSDMESLVRKFVENKASEDEIELLQEYFKTPTGAEGPGSGHE